MQVELLALEKEFVGVSPIAPCAQALTTITQYYGKLVLGQGYVEDLKVVMWDSSMANWLGR
jgi:hypothetical protein